MATDRACDQFTLSPVAQPESSSTATPKTADIPSPLLGICRLQSRVSDAAETTNLMSSRPGIA